MSSEESWYFTKEQLENSPSRRCGIDADKELSHRQQAANFIQDMGQRLQVTQLCINTAIVYMHRFYCFHSFSLFQRNAIASAALFLAAKVEEQPRKLEHIIKVAQLCLKGQPNTDRRSEVYLEQAQELVMNENILLMTLGFNVAIEHPHAFIVKFCHIANTSKDLSQTSYFMASNSLHLTTMCLQYKPTVVACFCIHLVCKWSNWQIPKSKENLPWYSYIDPSVTEEQLEQLTKEFLVIFDKCPSRLKKKIQNTQLSSQNPSMSNYPFDAETRKLNSSSGHQPQQSQSQSQSSSNTVAGQPSTLQHKSSSSDNQNQPGSSKNLFPSDHKKSNSVAAAVNHHHTFHSPAKPPVASLPSSSSSIASGGANNLCSSVVHDNVHVGKLPNSINAAVSSSQTRPTSNHSNASQPFNAFGTSSHSSHKSSNVTNNGHSSASAMKSKIPVAAVSHGNALPKELIQQQRADHRKLDIKPDPGIVKQESGVVVKQEPGIVGKQEHSITVKQEPGVVPAAAITNNHHSKYNHKKGNGLHQESSRSSAVTPGFVSTSHSEIISNVVKEVAKQNEKQRITVKSEPVEESEKLTSLYASNAGDSMKPPKSHSIFSPSPIGQSDSVKSSPVEERLEMVTIKTEPTVDTRRSSRTRNYSTSSGEPELVPLLTKVETMAGYEDILQKTVVSVPSTAHMVAEYEDILPSVPPVGSPSPKRDFGREKKSNAVPAVVGNNVSVKEEPVDGYDYAKTTNGGQLPHTDEHLALEKAESSECSSHSHKKKKKHKEKDKRHDKEKRHHKEKKRHKEDKHRHRKEHSTEKDVLKEPGPIKITIPKEKLVDIPMKLKIKINKDQIVTPSIVEDEGPQVAPVAADFKLKISKEKLKSRKRTRESDHEDPSKKFAYDPSSSHNGYK